MTATATTQTLYDPPSGWRYGFPRPYLPRAGETLADTLLRDGYPQAEIDSGGARHCRFIGDGARALAASVGAVVTPMSEKPIQTSDTEREQFNVANDNAPVRERVGDWMQTYSGRKFWPMDPEPSEIFIEDVAHSLAMQCRYAGHSIYFYSVAEHSVLMARWLRDQGEPETTQLEALLHDATEAYLVDVPRPVKPHLPGYREAEARVASAVAERFGLSMAGHPTAVHEADSRILADERAQNMVTTDDDWGVGEPLGVTLEFWTPAHAEKEFLQTFWNLVETMR